MAAVVLNVLGNTRGLRRELRRARQSWRQFRHEMNEAGGGFAGAQAGFRGLVAGAGGIAAVGTIAAGALAGIGLAAFRAADEYDQAVKSIVGATGAQGAALDRLVRDTDAVFRDTTASYRTVANVVGVVATAFSDELNPNVERATHAIVDLADVAGLSAEQVAETSVRVAKLFELSAAELRDFGDVVVAVGQEYGTSTDALLTALQRLGANLKALGLDAFAAADFAGQVDKIGIPVRRLNSVIESFASRAIASGRNVRDVWDELNDRVLATTNSTEQQGIANEYVTGTYAPVIVQLIELGVRLRDGNVVLEEHRGKLDEVEQAVDSFGDSWQEFARRTWSVSIPAIRGTTNAVGDLIIALSNPALDPNTGILSSGPAGIARAFNLGRGLGADGGRDGDGPTPFVSATNTPELYDQLRDVVTRLEAGSITPAAARDAFTGLAIEAEGAGYQLGNTFTGVINAIDRVAYFRGQEQRVAVAGDGALGGARDAVTEAESDLADVLGNFFAPERDAASTERAEGVRAQVDALTDLLNQGAITGDEAVRSAFTALSRAGGTEAFEDASDLYQRAIDYSAQRTLNDSLASGRAQVSSGFGGEQQLLTDLDRAIARTEPGSPEYWQLMAEREGVLESLNASTMTAAEDVRTLGGAARSTAAALDQVTNEVTRLADGIIVLNDGIQSWVPDEILSQTQVGNSVLTSLGRRATASTATQTTSTAPPAGGSRRTGSAQPSPTEVFFW